MIKQPIFISVESRKGGVGKTTAALYLAKEFVKQQYAVLLLDCDVTGTSTSAAIENSPLWHDKVNIIKVIPNDAKSVPFNLLKLLSDEKTVNIISSQFTNGEINVIGSDLYENDELVCDPRILVDELHSVWLIQNLQEVSACFSKYSDEKGLPAVIIIDNSPGYIGLSRGIHEWLTDLGPDCSRFLLVSSLDSQDVSSSISAAKEIERLQTGKIRVSSYFYHLANGGEDIPEEDAFLSNNSSFKRYFYSLVEKDDIKKEAEKGRQYVISDYLYILFNKVMDECFDKDYYFDFKECLHDDKSMDLLLRLYGNDLDSKHLPFIPFDQSLQFQFFDNFLRNKQGDTSDYWVKRFSELKKKTDDLFLQSNIVNTAYQLNGFLERLRKSLIEKGLRRLNSNIRESWLPTYCFEDLKKAIEKIAYYTNADALRGRTDLKKEDIKEVLTAAVRKFVTDNNLTEYEPVISSVFDYILRHAGIEKDNRGVALPLMVSSFIHAFMNVHAMRFNKEKSYVDFLITEIKSNKQIDFMNYVNEPIVVAEDFVFNKLDSYYANIIRLCMSTFYKSVNYALLRMMTLQNDYNKLVEALAWMTTKGKLRFIPQDIRIILDDNIVSKRSNWNIVDFRIYFLIRLEQSVFEQQYKKLLKNWIQ